MPRCVRNFWIDADVDGYANRFGAGPRNKEGGFDLSIKMRNDGEIETAIRITGIADENGNLGLIVWNGDDKLLTRIKTTR